MGLFHTHLVADPDGTKMNYYVILGIPVNADDASIRHAFRMLARRFHPDAGAGSSAEEFHRILEDTKLFVTRLGAQCTTDLFD